MKAFISYSHKDQLLCDKLHAHLAVMKSQGHLDVWVDQKILPGGEIDSEISEHLESCELFLPLVSSDFLDSGYCQDVEMTRAIELHHANQLRIVPIIIRPCDWQETMLGKLKCLPWDGNAVSIWGNEDAAFLDIVQGLRSVIAEEKQPEESTDTARLEVPSNKRTVPVHQYRARRDFDAIDRSEFRDLAFGEIRAYFEAAAKDINGTEGLRARLSLKGANTFTCTIVNSGLRPPKAAHIGVYAGGGTIGAWDIWYSFSEHDLENSANGILTIESDGYSLFLKPVLMPSVLMGHGNEDLMSPNTAAERIWREFLDQAEVSYG